MRNPGRLPIVLAVGRCLSRYAVFRGRAGRSEFWWWIAACTAANILLQAMMWTVVLGAAALNPVLGIMAIPFLLGYLGLSLGIILPTLAVTARRLHDTGRTGWWQLAWYAPNLGIVA